MRSPAAAALLAAAIFAPAARPYIRARSFAGVFVKRADFANVQFSVNAGAVPGLMNADGKPILSDDSDVMAAVQAAMAAWNAVPASAARFAPPEITTATANSRDNRHTIVIADSPAIRSLVGPSLTSQTLVATTANGNILDTDIVLNPLLTFSTTGAPDTYDLQAVLTKALGNALGANNSAVLSAALCFSTAPNSTLQQTLSPEDIAFVSAVYPSGGNSGYGTIGGTLSAGGAPLRNVLVNVADPTAGTVLTGLTSSADGTWSMLVPPGNYQIYAQPLTGPLLPFLLAIDDSQPVDTKFQPGFVGGNGSASTFAVNAGDTIQADFSPAATDNPPAGLLYAFSAVAPGAAAGLNTIFPQGDSHASLVPAGASMDFAVMGPGIDGTLADANIVLMGPMSLVPGTVKPDRAFPFSINGSTYQTVRFSVNVDPVGALCYGTVVILTHSGGIATYTGGVVILPPQ